MIYYLLGSDVDAEKLYSPRSDTTSGTNRKKTINSPIKTITRQTSVKNTSIDFQSTNLAVAQKATKPLNIEDETTSESYNEVQAKAIVHNNRTVLERTNEQGATVMKKPATQKSSAIMNKLPTVNKESTVLNTNKALQITKNDENTNSGMNSSGLNQSQAYKVTIYQVGI